MKKIIIGIASVFLLMGCETFEMDNDLQDPNNLTLSQADNNKLLNGIQVNFKDLFRGATSIGMNLTRMAKVSGGADATNYDNFVNPGDFYTDMMWQSYYEVIYAAETLRKNTAGKNLYMHDGISQVLEAYTYLTLVDYFGNVPFSEAGNGINNINPKFDKDSDVYAGAIKMLKDAKTNFSKTALSNPSLDMFYNNDKAKWIKLVNTLLLKAYLNTGNATELTALLNENNFIGTGEDFVYTFGTNASNPDARNPFFINNYAQAPEDYMATYFMWAVTEEKGSLVDPRRRYYFYRQVADVTASANSSVLPCSTQSMPAHYPAGTPFCYLGNGYWGRDMGNNDGIPPDTAFRTVWGVYPFGGRFDNGSFAAVGVNSGQAGKGYYPIVLSNYVDFMKAEIAQRFGIGGSASDHLNNAVDKNLRYVKDLFPQTGTAAMTEAQITSYKNLVGNLYTNSTDKLGVIMKEFYLGAYGNGVEAYNMYRRTGYPKMMQPMLQANPGAYPLSLKYPSASVENNANASQKPNNTVKVFWQTGTFNLN